MSRNLAIKPQNIQPIGIYARPIDNYVGFTASHESRTSYPMFEPGAGSYCTSPENGAKGASEWPFSGF